MYKKLILLSITILLIGYDMIKTESSKNEENFDEAIISIHEIYQRNDEAVISTLKSLEKIEGLTPIHKLDNQNYQENVIGLMELEENKTGILNQVNGLEGIPKDSFFSWSKNKKLNENANEEFFHLYLLKNVDEDMKIENKDIYEAKVRTNKDSDEYEIMIQFNRFGAEKWGNLTTKMAMDNYGFLAIVIDSEVYFCAAVNSPIVGGSLTIPGFSDKQEAKELVNRIKLLKE